MKTDLRALLKADAALSALAPGGIDWGARLDGGSGDNVVLSQVSTTPDYSLRQRLGATSHRVQIDCYSGTAGSAQRLADAVLAVIDGYRQPPILGVFLITSRDTREDDTDEVIHRVSMDFEVVHRG